ncbi:MAG: TrbI/VirB10 family protein [Burkholderiales bacterium]
MADEALAVAPQSYKARGLVPRNLLIGGAILFLIAGSVAYIMSLPEDTSAVLPEDIVTAELKDPQNLKKQNPGNPSIVDEMAAEAELAASDKAKGMRPAPGFSTAASAPVGALPVEQAHVLRPLPEIQKPAQRSDGRTDADEQALRQASAQVETAAAPATIFDESVVAGGTAGRGAEQPTGMAQLDDLMRRATAGVNADPTAAVAEAIKAVQGGGQRAEPTTGARGAQSWAGDLARSSTGEAPQPLRPNAQAARWLLQEGTVIPAVTTRNINSDMPGVVTARVSQDVYDSKSSRVLLLPKGALLVGRYNNQVDFGQERLQFAFTRLRLPDGSTFELPGFGGSDAAGQGGMTGDVNRHYARTFGSALLIGLLADRVVRPAAVAQAGPGGAGGFSATGQVMVDLARSELERLKATPTTITIPVGSRINVEVMRDLAFPSPNKSKVF